MLTDANSPKGVNGTFIFSHEQRAKQRLKSFTNPLGSDEQVSGPGLPADGGAELVQAPRGVRGGGVVQFGQAVHPLQDHLQHVADLPQHAAGLHAAHH